MTAQNDKRKPFLTENRIIAALTVAIVATGTAAAMSFSAAMKADTRRNLVLECTHGQVERLEGCERIVDGAMNEP